MGTTAHVRIGVAPDGAAEKWLYATIADDGVVIDVGAGENREDSERKARDTLRDTRFVNVEVADEQTVGTVAAFHDARVIEGHVLNAYWAKAATLEDVEEARNRRLEATRTIFGFVRETGLSR